MSALDWIVGTIAVLTIIAGPLVYLAGGSLLWLVGDELVGAGALALVIGTARR